MSYATKDDLPALPGIEGEQPNMMPVAPPATLKEMEAFVAAKIEAGVRAAIFGTAPPAPPFGLPDLFLSWPAPIVGEGTVSDEAPPAPPPEPPWVSSDADGRTRTAEWQESVRQRFERRVGAALTSTTQRT